MAARAKPMGIVAVASPAALRRPATRRWLPVAAAAGFWVLYSLLYASQHYLGLESGESPLSWWRLAGWQLSVNFLWAAATPVIIGLCRRYPFERATWARR